MERYEIVKAYDDFKERLDKIKLVILPDKLKEDIKELEEKMTLDGF